MCAKSASAIRSFVHCSDSARTRRNLVDRCHRSGFTSVTCMDAEPSCNTTRSTPAVRTSATVAFGRASARMVKLKARIKQAFLEYDFKKSKLGAEFKDVARFAEVDYRDAWRDVRTIQQANGVRYTQEGLSKLKREK